MIQQNPCSEWLATLQNAVDDGSFVKLSLNKPTAAAGDLKSVDLRPVVVKREPKLSFTYHHKTRDVVKNHSLGESVGLLGEFLATQFTAAKLHTTRADWHLAQKGERWSLTRHTALHTQPPQLSHDRAKHRVIESTGKHYLHALGIADAQGKINKNSHDKFSQINKYIEILDGLIKQLPPRASWRIVDMGAGKGYLTFALYDHLTNTLKQKAEVIGVEYRTDLVQQCNVIAQDSGFSGLRFVQGTIAEYDCTGTDIVIALHACDTATDDTIFKAVRADAALIVVAPCCHKQIRREMAGAANNHPLDFLMKYGTYVERIAEMVTDGMRGQLLELSGYRTNLFEFISDAHTPKNVMIVAMKSAVALKPEDHAALRASFLRTKAQFGIKAHQLEKLLGL